MKSKRKSKERKSSLLTLSIGYQHIHSYIILFQRRVYFEQNEKDTHAKRRQGIISENTESFEWKMPRACPVVTFIPSFALHCKQTNGTFCSYSNFTKNVNIPGMEHISIVGYMHMY